MKIKVILERDNIDILLNFYIEKKRQAINDDQPELAEGYRKRAFEVARAFETAEAVE